MTPSRHNNKSAFNDDETDDATDSECESLFDASDDDASDTDGTNFLSDDNDIDEDDELSNDEGLQPRETYQAEVTSLDVKRVRQKRYSQRTNERLDYVKDNFYE
jgi:hypothetical protein